MLIGVLGPRLLNNLRCLSPFRPSAFVGPPLLPSYHRHRYEKAHTPLDHRFPCVFRARCILWLSLQLCLFNIHYHFFIPFPGLSSLRCIRFCVR